MLTRLTRFQLTVFAIVTVVCLALITTSYLHLPAAVGLGSYKINAKFVTGGGIYQNANVTYRGVTIGRVLSVGLTDGGVITEMRLNSDTEVPDNVTATVKSVSAIGEQYIDLVPPATASQKMLRDGAFIGPDRTAVGQDISDLLNQAQALVTSVSNTRLQDLLRETFKAFNGSGPELSRMLHSSRLLVDEANANADQINQLLDQAGPLLQSQIRSGDAIKTIANSLGRLTAEAAKADPQVRSVLRTVPGAAQAANETFDGIRPTFPMLAANLANFGRIGVIYHKSIEQALVIFPALIAALLTDAGGVPIDEGGKLDFKVDLGDAPPCMVGFIPPPLARTPADTTVRELPGDLYCKTAQNDPSTVRGARNYPCQEFPGKRAPTVQLCRDPRGYVPIGSNPWRGPPVPYDTPVVDPRNITPANKFPNIPPGADYDPGPPSVHLPDGVPAGPGPAPNAPFPLPVPPNKPGVNPPPWPFFAPPDQIVPPYAQNNPPPAPAADGQPQAAGLNVTTYDPNTGVFADPAGGTGVLAAGTNKADCAETWVDLMKDPRQV
ncbi:MCE family protein [Mycobacterium sp. OTB74]|uniref:MCE family protein n=1 Tax=Mycobacterium sp. OTB74 TaxID=1853452 RepID=UPI00247435D6|nr:MCE family protein [Mycobacterium sp. OTB74]MDH6243807.1 phospholipid/cholesterol/gamma-HCH transport system substrate-binding protein [Mycobacterium sp. OTB74]